MRREGLAVITITLALTSCGRPVAQPPARTPISRPATRIAEEAAVGRAEARPSPPVETGDPGQDALAVYLYVLDAWNELVANDGDPASVDGYAIYFADTIRCSYDEFLMSGVRGWREPGSAYEGEENIGTWSPVHRILRATPDEVLLVSYRASFGVGLGDYDWEERLVELRRVDGRWLISEDSARGSHCVAPADLEALERLHPPPEVARCTAADTLCRRRCEAECVESWERFGLLGACYRCFLDECPCEFARCIDHPDVVSRICEGMP